MRFIEDMSVEKRIKYLEERRKIFEQQEKENSANYISGNKVQYRCEQINVTSIDDILRSNSTIKTQYSLDLNLENRLAKVKLEDYIYEINPGLLNVIFDFIKHTEFIKHKVYIKIGDDGRIDQILNKKELNDHWIKFLNSERFETEFVKKLRKNSTEILAQIIESGNKQFAIDAKSEEHYCRELFYMLIFDRHLIENGLGVVNKEEFLFRSVLIPEVIIPLQLESSMENSDKDQVLKYTKKGIAMISEEKKNEIVEKYNKYQKPDIKFNFTEYYLHFNLDMDLDLYTRLPINARLEIHEGVRHNIESVCNFKLRKLD